MRPEDFEQAKRTQYLDQTLCISASILIDQACLPKPGKSIQNIKVHVHQ